MVDVDKDEINRLKKKYKKFKNIKFYNYFLNKDSSEVDVNFSLHKGYISSKKINPNSIWFSLIRKNEKKITKVLNIKAIKNKDFIYLLDKNKSISEYKNELKYFYYKKLFIDACNYCQGRDYRTAIVEPAVQTRTPLEFKNYL